MFSLPRIPYSASKFAVRGLMEALYVELRQVGLDSIAVSVFVVILGDFEKTLNLRRAGLSWLVIWLVCIICCSFTSAFSFIVQKLDSKQTPKLLGCWTVQILVGI